MLEPFGHYEERQWPANPGAYGGRKSRSGGCYPVWIPGQLANRDFSFDGDAVAAIGRATQALERLNQSIVLTATSEALARSVLRAEGAASSRIEGLQLSQRRLARAAFRGNGLGAIDTRAAEVLGNVEAMQRAIELGASTDSVTVECILEIHRLLLRFTADASIAGVVRDRQNWIGGSQYHPLGAVFVPPPPDYVAEALADLCEFVMRDDLPPIAQAAIAHAQFENIHPFFDGNGRVGRTLIYLVLRRRGDLGSVIPPISLVLAHQIDTYVGAIAAFSGGDVDTLAQVFSDAISQAGGQAIGLAQSVEALQAQWIDRLGVPRKDAVVRSIIRELPAHPVIDVALAQRLTQRSHVAVGNALQQLSAAKVLVPLNERRWGRVWECDELIALASDFDRRFDG